nr:hypothetical protein [Clostridia bacterium]
MNKFKEMLSKDENPLGIFVDTASSYVVECLGRTGFDYIIIDNEHSPVDAETTAELVKAAELSGLTPFARVREIQRSAILKLLDVGAQGLIIPNVSSVEDVEKVVSYCKFYPIGNRGFCPSRKDGWGYDFDMSVMELMNHFNDEVLLIPQCETVGALRSIEEIVKTEGVDGIFIGPFDLSISMGIPGDFTNPAFQKAINKILEVCHENGKFCILFTTSEEGVKDGFAKGYDSMTYSLDAGLIIDCLKERVDRIKNGPA